MSLFGTLVFYGWIPVVLYLFSRLPSRQVVIWTLILGWLFLPTAELKIAAGIPAYNKMTATSGLALLGAYIFDTKRLSTFQLSWLDLPVLVFCICPFVTSISNDLGPYDGLSAVIGQTVTWGMPYYLGRIYLCSLEGLRKLVIGIVIGGLLYVPLCFIERRLTMPLSLKLYGISSPHFIAEISRYGGFRPEVFMESGLMVGLWMMAATLCAFWLWQSGALKKIWIVPIIWVAIILFLTSGYIKATGAFMILILGLTILFVAKWFHKSFIVLVLIAGICLYLYDGTAGSFNGDRIISYVSAITDKNRAASLDFRFQNEVLLSAKARQKLILGWGGWGRSRVYSHENGQDTSVTDSFWIITFGTTGLVGLASWTASLLLPVIGFVQSYPASLWLKPKLAPAAAIAVILVGYMLDCLSNAMINPVYMLGCGGLVGLLLRQEKISGARAMHLSPTEQ
ncbi:MAG: hypothetical protein JOZ78_04175 [Chroococcidiopsidaceae cyanobacterium CP_BM_ER_R8_30]|nr:hypothetical protein [Chroococcidiopsidaceae cyanobacterium CP_BM_ER_R8_30]